MSEFNVGATAPPFHPWCRCCTAPYFADMEGVGRRFARDLEDEFTYTVPKDMTYKQWKVMQDGNILDKAAESDIIFTKKQLGKKFGKHCSDWGLDPSSADDREKMKGIVCDIKEHYDSRGIGAFNGQADECLFYIKGDDVVVTKKNGEFVTVMRGGKTDGWVKNARRY